MTNILRKADDGLGRAYSFVSKTRKRAFFTGLMIYTLMFTGYFLFFLLPTIIETRSLLASDGISQYYPFLLEFRRNLITFFDTLSKGSPTFPMMNFMHSYGSTTIMTIGDFLPALPYYVFVSLVSEEGVPTFYGMGTVLLAYISGISFLYMCHYFRRDSIVSGFFSLFYVFCINMFFTALYNQQFLYMYIAFPLLIAGIDKVISKKGFIQFLLTVAWLSLGGLPFLVYTIPFVVLFAMIRVHYVYKENYFKNLGIGFIKGFSLVILGIGIAGFFFIPGIIDLLGSARTIGSGTSLSEMLTPSPALVADYLVRREGGQTGICTAVLPLIVYFIVNSKSKKEYQVYLSVMLVLVAMPVIYYGLNGFQYDLCRWGFIPSALLAYIGISTMQELGNTDKKQAITFTVVLTIYFTLIVIQCLEAAALFISAVLILTAITPLYKLICKLGSRIARLYAEHKAVRLAVPFLGFAVFMAVTFGVISNGVFFPVPTSIACASTLVAVWLYYRFGCKRITSALLSISIIVTSVFFFLPQKHPIVPIDDMKNDFTIINNVLKEHTADNVFGRISMVNDTGRMMKQNDDQESDDEDADDSIDPEIPFPAETASGTENNGSDSAENGQGAGQYYEFETDPQRNISLRYSIPNVYIFQSVINGNLMNLMYRAGIDNSSFLSKVNMEDFGGNIALQCLFGINCELSTESFDYLYDTGDPVVLETNLKNKYYLYFNKYAYPVGVTYSDVIGADEFHSFNTAEYPFAMMNTVYLDGSPLSESAPPSGKEYAHRVDITHEKVSRGVTTYGIECFDNNITVNEDVSDCFLFLTLEGVECKASEVYAHQYPIILMDDGRRVASLINNQLNDWPWIVYSDKYNIPLGHYDDTVKTFSFISPIAYTDMYLTAVPASEFKAAYEKCTQETLENIELAPNTLTGDITVTGDKVLSVNMLYDVGWKAYVDDVETKIYKSNDIFLGIPLTDGTHKIRLVYTYPHFALAMTVTAISIVITVALALIVYGKRKKKKEQTAG